MDISTYLNGSEIAVWHRIPGTNVEVKVRLLKPGKMRDVLARSKKMRYNGRRSEEYTDQAELNRIILDEVVVDWKNIERDGSPLPCTAENKRLLDDNWPAFSTAWNSAWAAMSEDAREEKEEEVKN